jgi:phosphopantothenoylcysteine decarboxylase/phosphopantothenate--cysteine ligase
MAHRTIRALVTAGGTREPIDDVRVLTNVSSGTFGIAIARALAAADVETTLLGSKEALAKLRTPEDAAIHRVSFAAYRDLAETLAAAAATPTRQDIVFMAAAVADYSPVPTPGKLPSDVETLTLQLRRNPKLIAKFREQFGIQTFLVGFKLLSRAPREELIARAREQLRRYRLNLVVANDLTAIRGGRRTIILVTPEGGEIPIEGTTDEVATQLVAFVLRRAEVRWGQSEPIPDTPTIDRGEETRKRIRSRAGALLGFAHVANLLPGTDGNISYRAAGLGFWVTPRQVPKATLTADDLIFVEPDLSRQRIRYRGAHKPSIDSIVQATLYAHLSDIKGFLHFHDGIVIVDGETTFPYPCGTIEEAEEILRAIDGAIRAGRYRGGPFAIRLTHHGYLIGIEPGGAERLAEEWREAEYAYRMHLGSVSGNHGRRSVVLQPIFASGRIIGVLAQFPDLAASSCFLLPDARAKGYGDEVIRQLDQRGDTIVAHDDCRVVEYYTARGYRIIRRDGVLAFLEPPSRRADIIAAASICCWHQPTNRVLIGKRLVAPFLGYHAFPGGAIEHGETSLAAALRELHEETSIALDRVQPVREATFVVGTPDGALAHHVTNFVVPLETMPVPTASPELEAAWVPIARALTLRPMGRHTTLRILKGLVRS